LPRFHGLQKPIGAADEIVAGHRDRTGFDAIGIFGDEASVAMIAANAAAQVFDANLDLPAARRTFLHEKRCDRHVASPVVRWRDEDVRAGRQDAS
jgi:hypothetical protein